MRKIKIIFTILVSLILLLGISNKSNAVTLSTSLTPSSVNSESEFTIALKFDEKIKKLTAYITYDPSLVTMTTETTDENVLINPSVDEGCLALMYSPIEEGISDDTFEVKVRANQVTTEKVAQFNVKNIKAVAESGTKEELSDEGFSVTIKPLQEIPEITDKKEEPSNQYTGNNLARAGENEILLFVIAGLIISAIVVKVKSKKIVK